MKQKWKKTLENNKKEILKKLLDEIQTIENQIKEIQDLIVSLKQAINNNDEKKEK